jgi:hypothetical protein
MNQCQFPEYHRKLVGSVAFMKTTLESLVGTYQILLMTINRFTDYTKVTHEIPLVPMIESIHLIDTLVAPVSCVQDLQNRIEIKVEPLDNRISEFIMTDRQWLQDNILCLVTNAVKFSMKGKVTIRVYLSSSSSSSSSSASSSASSSSISISASTLPEVNVKSPLPHVKRHVDIFKDIEIGTIHSDEDDKQLSLRFEVELEYYLQLTTRSRTLLTLLPLFSLNLAQQLKEQEIMLVVVD